MKTAKYICSPFLTLLVLCLLSQNLTAQNSKKKGDEAWDMGKIKTAVNHYSNVDGILEDKTLLAKRGLGYFKLNKLKRAINDFTQSKKLGNDDPELFFLMAQSKQHLNNYEEAAYFYKDYIKAAGEKSYKGQLALREIKNCAYSAFHLKDETTAFVESFGEDVNTYYDEVYALQSPQFGNTFYFSSNRNLKNNDVYSYSIDEKGAWIEDKDFDEKINSDFNEYVMDVSTDGLSMLFTRTSGQESSTKIFVSSFDQNDDQHIIELPEYLLDGAVDLQIIDHNTIAFASKDLGGQGGYDIFTINYKNGVWSDPINEGEIINTEYDERSPCFASNSEYLYFSSNRPYCYGGFDVYYYNKLGIESAPTNMGAPLNSSGNDLHYRLNIDGQMAVMSSDRKSGAGAYDIYQVYMQDFKPMPPKDDRQLEYLKDYYNYINPKEEVVEAPKTHLDQLKEKMEAEENDVAAEETASNKEAVIDLVDKEKNTETVEAKVVEESNSQTDAVLQETEPVTENSSQVEPVTNEEDVEVKPQESSEASSASIDEERIEQVGTAEQLVTVTQPIKEAPEKSVIEKTSEQNEPEVIASTNPRPAKNYTTIGKSQKPKTTAPAIPKKESGESPLSAIKKERQAISPNNVKFISGEKLENSILYQDRHDLMNDLNKAKLDRLVSYLKTNLAHHVHFVAHTDHLELGLPEYMQYNTLKRANLLAKYLIDNSIGKDRISIESVCSNYPFAKPELSGKVNEDYLAYNKRIDWEIRDEDNQILMSHNLQSRDIPGYALDRKHELYSLLREELYYSIEIASSPRIYKNAVLRLFTDIYIRKETQTSDNKYYIGLYNNYEDAVALQEKLVESSATYAKIVPFYNGLPIASRDMDLVAKDYPDLKNFISRDKK